MKTRLLRIIRNLFDLNYVNGIDGKTILSVRLKGENNWTVYKKGQSALSPIGQFAINMAEVMGVDFLRMWDMASKRIKNEKVRSN